MSYLSSSYFFFSKPTNCSSGFLIQRISKFESVLLKQFILRNEVTKKREMNNQEEQLLEIEALQNIFWDDFIRLDTFISTIS